MTNADRRKVETEASRQLHRDFGLRLSREDFDRVIERVLPPDGSVPDDWYKYYTPLTMTRPDLGAETHENRVLRLFVMTCSDAVHVSGRTAARAIQIEVDRLAAESRPEEFEAAIERVVSAVREKFTSGDIGGTDPRRSKSLAKLSLQWARARASEVLRLPPEGRAIAAGPMVPPEHQVGPGKRGEGRPNKYDGVNFGIQIAREFLARVCPRKRNTVWYRCIALIWIVSGLYEFQEQHDDGSFPRAVANPNCVRPYLPSDPILRASRLAAKRLGWWIRYHRGRDLPEATAKRALRDRARRQH